MAYHYKQVHWFSNTMRSGSCAGVAHRIINLLQGAEHRSRAFPNMSRAPALRVAKLSVQGAQRKPYCALNCTSSYRESRRERLKEGEQVEGLQTTLHKHSLW